MIPMQFISMDQVWVVTLNALLQAPTVETRIGPAKELPGYQMQLTGIEMSFLTNKRRRLSPYYACAETLWYLQNTRSVEMLKAYAPQYVRFTEDGDEAHGAYGHRIWNNAGGDNQIDLVINVLKDDPTSRQAVLTCWSASKDLGADKKDIPCTISLQFLVRDKCLNTIATMRSNDVWLGLPYDVFAFTCIQRIVADALGIYPGWYIHQAGSEHLYAKDWDKAEEAIVSSCRALRHSWARDSVDWKVSTVLATRQEAGVRGGRKNVLKNDGTMLADLAATCCHKWDKSITVLSTALKKGIENVDR